MKVSIKKDPNKYKQDAVIISIDKGKLFAVIHFDLSNGFETAFREYRRIVAFLNDTDQIVRLIVSFHDYSPGFWIEFKKRKLSSEDFVLQTTHGL